MLDRERVGCDVSPTTTVIESQSMKTTKSGGICGCDAGKKIKGTKRHTMVNTGGRALKLQVHSAAIQDGDGPGLLRASHQGLPLLALGSRTLRRYASGTQGRQPSLLRRHCITMGRQIVLCVSEPKQTSGQDFQSDD